MSSILPVLVIAALIGLNGLFVAAEFAIIGVPRVAIERRAAAGHRVARLVRRILDTPRLQDRYIATAQLGITAASLGLGMYGEHVLAHWLEGWLEGFGAARWLVAHGLATVLAVAILTYLHIVVGEMVPKSLALAHAERTALWVTPPMLWVRTALYPLVLGLNGLGNGMLRLLGIHRQVTGTERFLTAEELALVVEESDAGGLLRAEAGQLLHELFEFGELTAREVMTPRIRLADLPLGASPEQVRALVRAAHHTRYPVYEGDIDHIVGMVHIKDLLRRLLEGGSLAREDVRPVPFVPETARLDAVLAAMHGARSQLVVVLDEFGGVAGMVTLEDLFEEVVGAVDDGVVTAPLIEPAGDDGYRVAGITRLDELGERLGRELADADVDTVGGPVLTLLGRPPVVGDVAIYDGLRFTVTAVAGRGVGACFVALADDGAAGRIAPAR